jgi:hypothetical protein
VLFINGGTSTNPTGIKTNSIQQQIDQGAQTIGHTYRQGYLLYLMFLYQKYLTKQEIA